MRWQFTPGRERWLDHGAGYQFAAALTSTSEQAKGTVEAGFGRRGGREGGMGSGYAKCRGGQLVLLVTCVLAGGGGNAESQTGPAPQVGGRWTGSFVYSAPGFPSRNGVVLDGLSGVLDLTVTQTGSRLRVEGPALFDTGQRIGILLIGEMDTAGVFRSPSYGFVDGEEVVAFLEPESAENDPVCGGMDTDGPEISFSSGPNATYTETGSSGSCGTITITADLRRQDAAVSVVQIRPNLRPLSGDAFGPGDRIEFIVEFNRAVVVTGNPKLRLRIGEQFRSADLVSVSGVRSSRHRLTFRHFVDTSDRDDDGVSIPADALLLEGGSIKDLDGNDADLAHPAVPDDPELKVNGRLDAVPTITRVYFSGGGPYGHGRSLSVVATFSEPIYVTGAPQLEIVVGRTIVPANLHSRRSTRLVFEYVVGLFDLDTDGVGVLADAFILNGGSIRDADGNDADLTHDGLPDDPRHTVDGSGGAPTVERMDFIRLPAAQDTYAGGETIFVQVGFTRGVEVTGTPQVAIEVGERMRRADHIPTLRAAQLLAVAGTGNSFHSPGEQLRFLYFEYVVQPSDFDDDGVSVPADALTLNGGSIRAWDGGSDADLSHDGIPDDGRRMVDGSRDDDQAPVVTVFSIEPPVRGVFGGGDAIELRLSLSEGVTVTGAPRVALRIGERTRFATFRERWGTTSLLFEYVVQESDRDDDGLGVAADAVDLNGGTIRDNAGLDADLDLGYRAFDADPDYKVDGRLTAVPALPLVGTLALFFLLLVGGRRRLGRRS